MTHLTLAGRILVQALIAVAVPGGLIAVGIYQLVRRQQRRHRKKENGLQQNENH